MQHQKILAGRLRDEARYADNVFLHELTDSQEFDWKDIVGPGIYRFAFVWLSSTDSYLRERRGDFLVAGIDGIDIRLHPQRLGTFERSLNILVERI